MASLSNQSRVGKCETTREWINNNYSSIHFYVWLSFSFFILASSTPLPVNVTLQSTIQLGTSDSSKIRVPRTYSSYSGYPSHNGSDYGSPFPYPYGSQPSYEYSQGTGQSYPMYQPPTNSPNYLSSGYSNQYNYPNQYQNQQPYHHSYSSPPSSSPYHYPPPLPSSGSHSSSYYSSPVSSPYHPSASYASHSYPASHFPHSSHSSSPSIPFSSSSSASDDGPVFLGGVFDLKEFSKMSNIPVEDLIKMGGTAIKSESKAKTNRDEESEDEDEIGETVRRRNNQSNVSRRKKKKKRRRKQETVDSDQLRINHESSRRDDDDYEEEEGEEGLKGNEEKQNEKEKVGNNDADADEEDDDVVLKITRERNSKNRSRGNQGSKVKSRTKITTTSSTTAAPVQPYPVIPFPYPFPISSTGFGAGQSLVTGSTSAQSTTKLSSEESQLSPTSVKIGKKPSKHDSDDDDPPVSRPVKENIINVNLPDLFGPEGIFDSMDPNRGDMYNPVQGIGGLTSHRRVSISGFTQGIVKRALKSMVYRIFPSVKNAKKVAAKGCRDVQTIGSMDSILMPLGIAVTLHPLLLPLVPFLLLALGSIKAIESATCFVSEFFK